MKVAKKHERLARALLLLELVNVGFPEEKTQERVDEAWPCKLDDAEWLNCIAMHVQDYELDGNTTQEEINRWKGD